VSGRDVVSANIVRQKIASVRACGYHGARHPAYRGEARTRPSPRPTRQANRPTPSLLLPSGTAAAWARAPIRQSLRGDLSDLPKPGQRKPARDRG
jgi:hypothetical protein